MHVDARQSRIDVGRAELERRPVRQRTHQRCALARAIRHAAIVDQPGLNDGVARRALIVARQHMIVAEQILVANVVAHQSAERAAATVEDAPAGHIVIAIVAARAAKQHRHRLLKLVRRRIAGDARRVEQNLRGGGGLFRARHQPRAAGGGDQRRRRVGDRAARVSRGLMLAVRAAERAHAAGAARRR